MSDTYREVVHTSYGSRILNSFTGALLGLIMFFGAFVLIWWNEGKTNLAEIAAQSLIATAETVAIANEGKFLAVTGQLVATAPLGDAPYLKTDNYLQLQRQVESFAWREHQTSTEKDLLGGGKETITEYTYTKEWVDSPANSNDFKISPGHLNPKPTLDDATLLAPGAHLGAFEPLLAKLTLPAGTPLTLTEAKMGTGYETKLFQGHLFLGKGTLEQPELGDMRISYTALTSPLLVTLFGEQRGNRLVPYAYENGNTFFRAHNGDRNTAIAELQSEHTILTWLLRGMSFLLIWISIILIFNPINAILAI
jgi:hypothetical protein